MNRFTIIIIVAIFIANCSSPNANVSSISRVTPTRIKTPVVPKNGDYPEMGVITKINNDLGSVELNHEEIKDLMPAMQMEFFVSDKSLLKGLNIGDNADLTLRYNDGQETIVSLSKTK